MARCTVARLMRDLGLRGVVRGRRVKTTAPDELFSELRLDRVNRQFNVSRLECPRWVADLTYVATWRGFVYALSLTLTHGALWVGAYRLTAPGLALDALQALYGHSRNPGALHHSDRGVQYLSIPRQKMATSRYVGTKFAVCSVWSRLCSAQIIDHILGVSPDLIEQS